MKRRAFLGKLGILTGVLLFAPQLFAKKSVLAKNMKAIRKITKSDAQWKSELYPLQYNVLRKEATEKPFYSTLNDEKREGTYVCVGCELELFRSETKFDSGTGWPSFYRAIKNHTETKTDFFLIFPRTEYHCARCGGHQGHIFDDGPEPTGQRWCNNGVALKFIPKKTDA